MEELELRPIKPQPPSPVNLSPYAVYSIDRDSSDDISSQLATSGPVMAFIGSWARAEDRCHAHLVCPVLEGNSCGDFGIGVRFGDGSEHDLCWTRRSYRFDSRDVKVGKGREGG